MIAYKIRLIWDVHDRKSVLVVASLGNNALVCKTKKRNRTMFLMTYCNTCRRNY